VNLLALIYGPPWAWIDGVSRPYGTPRRGRLAYTARFGNGRLGAVAHHCDGLARHHELPKSTDIREPDMISAADIKDQELTIIVSMMLMNSPVYA